MHLHIETEIVRQMASQISQIANTMTQETGNLNGSVNRLSANWSGPGSTDFVLTLQALIHQIAAARDEADLLHQRIVKFVEAWETVDRQGVHPGEGTTAVFYRPRPRGNLLSNPSKAGNENSDRTNDSTDNDLSNDVNQENRDRQPPAQTVHNDKTGQSDRATEINAPNQPNAGVNHPAMVPGGAAVGAVAGAGVVGSKRPRTTAKNAPPRTTQANKSASPTPSNTPSAPLSTGGWTRDLEKFEQTNVTIAQLEQLPERGPLDEHNLRELYEEQQQLQAKIDAGIEANGRSLDANPFPEGECTWFATSKRDLYPAVRGHAKYWAEQAANHGLEVGQLPIKGSVMVWQPNVFNAHAEFGHVSFVENVERLADGSFKIFYTDNLSPDTVRHIIFSPNTEGVDFIY